MTSEEQGARVGRKQGRGPCRLKDMPLCSAPEFEPHREEPGHPGFLIPNSMVTRETGQPRDRGIVAGKISEVNVG